MIYVGDDPAVGEPPPQGVPPNGPDQPFPSDPVDPCADAPQSDIELRNPFSGQCESFHDVADKCGPAPGVPLPSWGACEGECSAFDNDQIGCLSAAGCRVAYAADSGEFLGCWATDTLPPIDDKACAELDSWNCSLRDDCVAVHAQAECKEGRGDCGYGNFVTCVAEPTGCYGSDECGSGSRCNAEEICAKPPECETEDALGCGGVCYGLCVPAAVSCFGEVVCKVEAPACAEGEVPSVSNGCWTGECVAAALCETVACADITTGTQCAANQACQAFYEGTGCDASGNCTEYLFSECKDA